MSCAKTDKILGAHIVGFQRGRTLGECVLAMEHGAATEDIARTCHGHRTLERGGEGAARHRETHPLLIEPNATRDAECIPT